MASEKKIQRPIIDLSKFKKAPQIIYQTNDYGLFSYATGNRPINDGHVREIVNSMEKEYLMTIIFVNERFEIIDGQHRHRAIQQLGKPLFFSVVNGYGEDEMQIYNLNGSNWNNSDFCSRFIALGNQNYIDYRRFRNKYKFGHGESLMMLTNAVKFSTQIGFKEGLFEIRNYKEACEIAEEIYRVEPYFKDGFRNRGFVLCIFNLLKNNKSFSMDKFIHKCKEHTSFLKKCATTDQYMDMIEHLYNYRSANKVSLKY